MINATREVSEAYYAQSSSILIDAKLNIDRSKLAPVVSTNQVKNSSRVCRKTNVFSLNIL